MNPSTQHVETSTASGPPNATLKPAERLRQLYAQAEMAAELEAARERKFAASNLDEFDARRLLAVDHPMLEKRYFIATDETSSFEQVVNDHVLARQSGLYISGDYRVGKTSAIKHCMARLANKMPSIALFYYSAEREANRSRKSMFRDMLDYFLYPISKYQDPDVVLVRFMIARSVKAGGRTCLLFIDEAHKLTVRQLSYLLGLWNRLAHEEFVLVTVLVGQDGDSGLESLRVRTREEDHGAVIARFLVKPYLMGGLHSERQLNTYLSAFDSELTYPPQSTWAYSRYFLQRAFDKGWRLSNESGRMWQALCRYTGMTQGKIGEKGYRLAFVNSAITAFLLDAMPNDKAGFQGNSIRWSDAIARAGQEDVYIERGSSLQ